MTDCKIIKSDEILQDFEHHFKVSAGPGAGKTHWLINHIQNILRNSKFLSPTSKIACITYTNVAADEMKERLKENGNKVEISTIHCFLYNNIIKYYIHLLKKEDGNCIVNFDKLNGHDEHKPSKGKIITWLDNTGKEKFRKILQKKRTTFTALCFYLQDLKWELKDNHCILTPGKFYKKPKYFPTTTSEEYLKYKDLYWQQGIIHHEDVLFFAFEILQKFPLLLDFISAKFKYVFIDEFQDTNPIQTEIIKLLGGKKSLVGVIGDTAQSIYGFQNAKPEDFVQFKLPEQMDYCIEDNRRSSKKILCLLNHIREQSGSSIIQKCVRDEEGKNTILFIGEEKKSVDEFIKICTKNGNYNNSCILLRKNDDVKRIKKLINSSTTIYSGDIWESFREIDYKRERFIHSLFESIQLAKDNAICKAIEMTIKVLRTDSLLKIKTNLSKHLERTIALYLIESFMTQYDDIMKNNLLYFYNFTKGILNKFHISLPGLRNGRPKKFLEETESSDTIISLRITEEKSAIRTIHKAKGAEFDAVFVSYKDESEIQKRIITPNLNVEETRLFYVAVSRARDFLFLAVPTLNKNIKDSIHKLGIDIVEL